MSYWRTEASVVRPSSVVVVVCRRRLSSNFQNATLPTPLDGFLSYWVTIVPGMGEVKVVGLLQVAPPFTTLAPPMMGSKTRKTLLLPQISTDLKSDGTKL